MTNKKFPAKDSTRAACSIVSIPLSMSHTYLISCQSGYLQIDTGYEHDYPLYRRNLAKAGIPIESIRYLLLTHHHDDHAGFLNELTRATDLTILAHEQAAGLLRNGKNDKTRGEVMSAISSSSLRDSRCILILAGR